MHPELYAKILRVIAGGQATGLLPRGDLLTLENLTSCTDQVEEDAVESKYFSTITALNNMMLCSL